MNHPPTRSLRDLAEINPRGSRVSPDELVSFVGMADLDEVAARNTAETPRRFGEVSKGYTPFQNGDLLAAKITPCWQNGKVGEAVLTSEQGMGSTEFHVIRPGPDVDRRYLLHFLRTANVRDAGTLRMTGSGGQRRVPAKFMSDLPVPSLPLQEQRRIASILDKADAIRTKRRSLLAHIDSLERSSFLEAFGDLDARSHVTDALLESKGAIRTGPFGSQLLHEEFVDEGVAVLGLDNVVGNDFKWAKRRFITPAKYAELSRYTVHPGDVLISIMGTVGRCVVVPEGIPASINTKHICAITLDRSVAQPTFVRAAFLWHPATRRYLAHETKGAIMAGLNMGIIKRMPLPLPPLGAQIQFADKVTAIRAERDHVARALEADEELFAALQHRAFRGEL